jgi:hypothetical protein
MIVPSASAVLHAIETTFASVIRPALTGTAERSAAATIEHLLRHVRVRIRHEGQILLDDVAALRTLLESVEQYLRGLDDAAAMAQAESLERFRHSQSRAVNVYPDLESLAGEAGAFRAALTSALVFLQSVRVRLGTDSDYQRIRGAIRAYIAWQIQSEDELILPAFDGFGPRR